MRVAITAGDPEGIGPEVAVAAASVLGTRADLELVLVGQQAVWERAARVRGVELGNLSFLPVDPDADLEHGHLAAVGPIATAVRGCQSGRFDAVCTAPIHKATLLEAGFPYAGHTPYLAALCGQSTSDAVMVFAGGQLAVSLVTGHVPLSEVPGRLGPEAVVRAARAGAQVISRLIASPSPRIAICGLNPHAGEGGRLGHEDQDLVAPGIDALVQQGFDASGPWPADTIFARALNGEFDLVVALYHDQGLIPVKTLDFGRSVNITAGLSIVRTSVDHGTARDIAWTGTASAEPMVAAIEMAARLAGKPDDAGASVATAPQSS